MSKKKLLEFGLKEADAFQKNFKIIFDRLVRGYRRLMGKDPEGIDLLKVKMEAREKALNTTKVVNQKGLTLDPDKPIVGGTQEGIETIKTRLDLTDLDTRLDEIAKDKQTRILKQNEEVEKRTGKPFKQGPYLVEELDEFNLSKDDPMGDLEKIIKGEGDTGLPKEGLKSFKYKTPYEFSTRKEYEKYLDEMLGPDDDVFGNPMKDQMLKKFDELELKNVTPRPTTELFEEALGVRLYGDETFGELMEIKETGVHPRGEPPIKKADGGRVQFALGGPTNIIGSGLLGGTKVEEEDEFADIQGQTAGLGVLTGLKSVFGSKLGQYIFNKGRQKVFDTATDRVQQEIQRRKQAKEAAQALVTAKAFQNKQQGTGGYQSSFGGDRDFMGGRGTAAEMGSFANGGLVTLFTEKR